MFRSSRDVLSWKRDTDWIQVEGAETVDKSETYNCNQCSEGGWTSETDLELHRINEHISSKRLYRARYKKNFCGICIHKYADQEEVLKHIKIEHLLSTENATRVEREIFICNDCSSIFFNKSALIYHTSYWHCAKKSNIVCPFCDKSLQSTYYLSIHFNKHVKKSISTCRICLVKCKNTANLKNHYKKHPYFLKCEMCYFETNRIDSFHSHLDSHHKIDQDELDMNNDYKKCFIPKESSYMRLQRLISLRGLRLSNNVHICILCREICVGEDQMKSHVNKHKNKISEAILGYVCSCGQIFTNKVLFKHHIFKSKHLTNNTHQN